MGLIDTKTLTRGLIAWMRREGLAPTRTRLVKFLYLADLQHARYKGGETLTTWRWYTGPFGPVAVEALQLFDQGVREGWLRQWAVGGDDEAESDRRAVGYDLPEQDESLHEAMPPLLGKVREWMKRYGDSTPNLLRFVYGDTEPMQNVREGEVLNFSRARPLGPGPAVQSAPLPRKQVKRLDDLVARLRAEYSAARAASAGFADGPRDAAYLEGVPTDDDLPSGEFIITFPRSGDE
jgi:hypothetical protein